MARTNIARSRFFESDCLRWTFVFTVERNQIFAKFARRYSLNHPAWRGTFDTEQNAKSARGGGKFPLSTTPRGGNFFPPRPTSHGGGDFLVGGHPTGGGDFFSGRSGLSWAGASYLCRQSHSGRSGLSFWRHLVGGGRI